jgi:glycosyltransferase involved in cell wall biosynthesis
MNTSLKNINYSITIVIPVYNGEMYISTTIESCLRQDYTNIKIVVIDDASIDRSYSIMKKFESYENVIILRNKVNLGISKTINKAVREIDSDTFIFLGHDDILNVDHVSKMIELYNEEVSLIFCNSVKFDDMGNLLGWNMLEDKKIINKRLKNPLRYLSITNFISSTGAIINRRNFLLIGGFDEDYKNYGEWLAWIKLSQVGIIKFNFNTFAFYRRHQNNITNTFITKPTDLLYYYNKCRLTAKAFYGKSKHKYFIDVLFVFYEKIFQRINFILLNKKKFQKSFKESTIRERLSFFLEK